MAARQYRHEEIAAVPRGWRVRTIPQKGHLVRVAFPPGPRKKGAGKVISILHPIRENPAACNPEGLHLSLCVDPQVNPIYVANERWVRTAGGSVGKVLKVEGDPKKGGRTLVLIPGVGAVWFHGYVKDVARPARPSGNPATVRISGVEYEILDRKTPDEHESAGLSNLAREMRKYKIAAGLTLARPRGDSVFQAYEYENGRLGRLTSAVPGVSAKEWRRGNPLLDALVGGAAAGAAVVGSQEAIKKIRERKGKGMWPFRRSNQNNDKQAHQLYRDFHGRGPSEVLALTESILADGTYVALGDNPEIWLGPVSGVDPINWRQPDLALDPEDRVKVAMDAEGAQFYFVRGNQAIPRQVLDRLAGAGIDVRKRFLDLGQVYALSYQTEKKFDGFKTIPYAHRFGKNGNGRPMLVYDQETKKLLLVGGVYSIAPYDAALGASPGVVN